MSFHPNDMHRRAMGATVIIAGMLLFLTGGFFRSQVLQHQKYALQAETNRLRELPLPAPRGVIYDRNHKIIADNVIGYSVSLLAPKEDSLRVALAQLAQAVNMTPGQVDQALRRFRRSPGRPAVVIPDASFDVVSVLEEHRTQFPGLIIQSAPRRFYPDGEIVAPFVGYVGEISETELARLKDTADYKAGQQLGKQGLEKEYENVLHGKEGSQFVEIDARGRIVHETGARPDLAPVAADSLQTNIDMDLQRVAASLFGDTLQGGVVALDPKTGGVLALYSAPSWDANRFFVGIPAQYWDSLRADPRRPLYNKALQGEYPPGSTFKIATAVTALELGVVRMDEHMPVTCTAVCSTARATSTATASTAACRSPRRSPSPATPTSISSASSSVSRDCWPAAWIWDSVRRRGSTCPKSGVRSGRRRKSISIGCTASADGPRRSCSTWRSARVRMRRRS